MNNNYETYIKYLTKLLGEDIVSNLVAVLGEENIKNASYATTSDTGLAFAGSYVDTVLSLAEYFVIIPSCYQFVNIFFRFF